MSTVFMCGLYVMFYFAIKTLHLRTLLVIINVNNDHLKIQVYSENFRILICGTAKVQWMFPLFRMVIHTVVIVNGKPMPYSWSCHRDFLLPCTFLPCKKSFSVLWQVGLPSLKAWKHTDLGLICVFYCVRCQVSMSLRIRSVETIKSHLHCY